MRASAEGLEVDTGLAPLLVRCATRYTRVSTTASGADLHITAVNRIKLPMAATTQITKVMSINHTRKVVNRLPIEIHNFTNPQGPPDQQPDRNRDQQRVI